LEWRVSSWRLPSFCSLQCPGHVCIHHQTRYNPFILLQIHLEHVPFISSSLQFLELLFSSWFSLYCCEFSGPIEELCLQAVRNNVRGQPIDLEALNKYVEQEGGSPNFLKDPFPPYIPNEVLHPSQPNWIKHGYSYFLSSKKTFPQSQRWQNATNTPLPYPKPIAMNVFFDVFGKITPVYLVLTFVPMVALKTSQILKSPIESVYQGMVSAGRSTAFLAAFVSSYMFLTSAHRRLLDIQFLNSYFKTLILLFLVYLKLKNHYQRFADLKTDHKLVYWIIGLFASWSILLERSSRRSELALYALPRALDSIYQILYDHKVIIIILTILIIIIVLTPPSFLWLDFA